MRPGHLPISPLSMSGSMPLSLRPRGRPPPELSDGEGIPPSTRSGGGEGGAAIPAHPGEASELLWRWFIALVCTVSLSPSWRANLLILHFFFSANQRHLASARETHTGRAGASPLAISGFAQRPAEEEEEEQERSEERREKREERGEGRRTGLSAPKLCEAREKSPDSTVERWSSRRRTREEVKRERERKNALCRMPRALE